MYFGGNVFCNLSCDFWFCLIPTINCVIGRWYSLQPLSVCLHLCRHQRCVWGLRSLSLCPDCRGTSFKSLPSTSSVSCLNRYHPCAKQIVPFINQIIGQHARVSLWSFKFGIDSVLCRQILPTAQRLLDELLSSQSTAINTVCGAPGTAALTTQSVHDRQSENKLRLSQCTQFAYLGGNFGSHKSPLKAKEYKEISKL